PAQRPPTPPPTPAPTAPPAAHPPPPPPPPPPPSPPPSRPPHPPPPPPPPPPPHRHHLPRRWCSPRVGGACGCWWSAGFGRAGGGPVGGRCATASTGCRCICCGSCT